MGNTLFSPSWCSRAKKGLLAACQASPLQGSIFWRLGHLCWELLSVSSSNKLEKVRQVCGINCLQNEEKKTRQVPQKALRNKKVVGRISRSSSDWLLEHHHLLTEADSRDVSCVLYILFNSVVFSIINCECRQYS